jgi:hypothetical protein
MIADPFVRTLVGMEKMHWEARMFHRVNKLECTQRNAKAVCGVGTGVRGQAESFRLRNGLGAKRTSGGL